MRTRSVQLVTSWWVVGVWAALSLATGLVSVVAVLQPAWYVRYSQIHAQDAQGVAFQVMVSSVGPLGYCRLAGVRQVTVPAEERRPGYVEYPAGSLLTTPATMWTSAHPSSTGTSRHPLDTKKEGVSSTQPPTEDIPPTTVSPRIVEGPATSPDTDEGKTSSSDEGSTLQPTGEITTINTTIYTTTNTTTTSTTPSSTSSFGSRYKGKPTSSPRQPITSTTITSTSTSTSTTDSSVTTAEANRPEELLTTTQSLSVDDPTEAGAAGANFVSQEPQTTTTGIPGTPRGQNKSSGVDEAVTPRVEMGVGGGGGGGEVSVRKDRKNKNKKPTQAHTTVRENVSVAPRRNTTTPAATKGRRKKKGKYRRRKKKNRRKRPRERDGGKVIGRSHGRGAPRPEPPLHHLLRSRLAGREEPLASPLLQRSPQQEKLVSTDYQPRQPILYCSGVGGGVGSGSSAVWALVGVLYGVAGVVQVAVGVASLALHLPHAHTHAKRYIFAAWLGNVQVAIVMSQGVALVLFPLGLGSPLARGECGGSSSVYWPGACSFGWSYMLGVVATTLSAYCPCLARLTVFRRYDYKEWDSINFF